MVGLLNGSALRLMEALSLRVKDISIERRELCVRDGKGGKDRLTLLPQSMFPALARHLSDVRKFHQRDRKAGWGQVLIADALGRQYPSRA